MSSGWSIKLFDTYVLYVAPNHPLLIGDDMTPMLLLFNNKDVHILLWTRNAPIRRWMVDGGTVI